MEIIDKIQNFIDNLDDKKFYSYLAAVLGGLLLISSLILWHYYSSLSEVQDRIETINEQRSQAKSILTNYERVKKHRNEVNALLAEDPNFKIGGYWASLLASMGLSSKQTIESTSHIDHANKYREYVQKATLTDLNMKQLTELLDTLDHNKRIYTKDLEITKSNQKPAIDVTITIATLEPISAQTA